MNNITTAIIPNHIGIVSNSTKWSRRTLTIIMMREKTVDGWNDASPLSLQSRYRHHHVQSNEMRKCKSLDNSAQIQSELISANCSFYNVFNDSDFCWFAVVRALVDHSTLGSVCSTLCCACACVISTQSDNLRVDAQCKQLRHTTGTVHPSLA